MTAQGIRTDTFTCHSHGITGLGPTNTDIMFVGVAPAKIEMKTHEPYSGQTGQLLRAVLRSIDIDPDSCYMTNLLCYDDPKPTLASVQDCLPRLVREIDTIKPKVIVALGALPIQLFTGYKGKEVRGSCLWSDTFNCWIVTSWQPTVVFQVSPGLISDVVRDMNKIKYIMDKPKDFGHVDYEVITAQGDAQRVLDSDWLRTAKFPALDVECKWDAEAEKWTDDIRCLSISDGQITYVFPESVLTDLHWPTDEPNWTFHNASFDTEKLMKDQGVELRIGEDTMLMSYTLDERGGSDDEAQGVDIAVGIHGLKRLSREYCGAGFYDREVDLKTSPDATVWEYNARDAAYTSRLAAYFYDRQVAEGVRQVYLELILPEVRLCRDERMHGVWVDKANVNRLAIEWGTEWLTLDDTLRTEAEAYGWPEENFNFNSPVQMKRFVSNYLLIPIDNTRADTLEKIDHPWIKKRVRIKRIDKQLKTYVTGIMEAMDDNSRVHPEPSIHATVSGRKTYHKPPVGTIPTGSQYINPDEEPDEESRAIIAEFRQVRGLFGAPPGKVFIEADFSAAELWTAAFYTDDDVMLADLLSGDFHSNAAETMFKCNRNDYSKEHWSGMRRNSKYVTFGVLYWREAPSLYNPGPNQGGNLGKLYSLQQIREMVIAWHQRYNKHAAAAQLWEDDARRTGEQTSISGRRRRYYAPGVFPNFRNMAANWPIQTVSHDHLVAARLEFDSLIRTGRFPARTLFDGHDACYFEADEADVADVLPMIKEVMERPRWFDRGIPVEIKVGTNWANGKVVL